MANKNFRYWAQRVLPLVYDDSLSYYEILCKIIDKINEIEEVWDPDKIEEILNNALDEYLESIDIYDEVMQNLDLYFADVLDYAADPTGTSDSTSAFSAALATTKGVVVVPPGQYIINNLVIPSNKTIYGYGAEIIATDWADGLPNAMRNDNPNNLPGYDATENVRIEGFSFTSPNLRACCLVAFGHANNITIRNCRFHHWNGYHGIEFNAVSNGTIQNCTFDNYGATDGIYSECVQLDYMSEPAIFRWFGPYNNLDCENIKIINNTFKGTPAIRDHSQGSTNYLYSAIGSHTPRANYIRNILIDGNYIENFYNGIEMYDLYDSTISNNIIKGCYIGIFLSHYIVRNTICNNNIRGLATADNHPDQWRGIAVYRQNDTRIVRDNYINNNIIFDFTYGITYQGINSIISNNDITRGIIAGIMCGIKESSNQYMYNRVSSSNGDATHKTITVNITDGDNITSGGILVCNNLADYCYVNATNHNGSRSFVSDNRFNGGITYGADGTENICLYRNLVSGKYSGGLITLQSEESVTIPERTWTNAFTRTLSQGGVFLVIFSATTRTVNSVLSVQLHRVGYNNTGTVVAPNSSGGYTATTSFIVATNDGPVSIDGSMWANAESDIANWKCQIIDMAVSPLT